MKHYEKEIPTGYREDLLIDAKKPKTSVIINLIALAIIALLFGTGMFIKIKLVGFNPNSDYLLFALIGFFVSFIIAIVLHELIHGLFYKIFTKEKLTFGLTLSVAYCGVPNLYIRKKAAFISAIAPCVIISLALLVPMILVKDSVIWSYIYLLFSCHFAGCIGDLYLCLLILFKYKKKEILINDTGPKQTIYVKIEEENNEN